MEQVQKLVLFIENTLGLDFQSELIQHLKINLNAWEIPKEIICLPHFIYTNSGKIDRSNTLTLYFNHLKS